MIDNEKMERVHEKVFKIDAQLIYKGSGGYACGYGHFGGSGGTYYQNCRRAVVAYDDNRLLVLLKGSLPKDVLKTGERCEGGGMLAFGSFDGGKTWGGITEGEKRPQHLANWYWRANGCSDSSGSIYLTGTQNCASYHERYDVFLRRLAFTGKGWIEDRFAIVDQNLQKCPGWSRVLKLPNGRIWASWTEGWGGVLARYSDDDAYTWAPCKDASAKAPRPFYNPLLKDMLKPESERQKSPESVLFWPATPVVPSAKFGSLMIAYKKGVALFGMYGAVWQIHDGEKWGAEQKIKAWKSTGGFISETVIENKIFLARKIKAGGLEAVIYDGNEWKHEILDSEKNIGSSILTASGKNVYCFYIKKAAADKYEVRYRKWSKGKWEESVLVATDEKRLNHVAAPQICPPNYACVFWDQYMKGQKRITTVRFSKIPN